MWIDSSRCNDGAIDTLYLQGMLDTTSANRDALRIPAGCVLRLDDTLTLSDHSKIIGDTGSELRFVPNPSGVCQYTTYPSFIQNPAISTPTNIWLQNFYLRGCGAGTPAGPSSAPGFITMHGIRLLNVDTFLIDNVEVSHTPTMGIQYQNSKNGRILDSYVHNTGRDGITGLYSYTTEPPR